MEVRFAWEPTSSGRTGRKNGSFPGSRPARSYGTRTFWITAALPGVRLQNFNFIELLDYQRASRLRTITNR